MRTLPLIVVIASLFTTSTSATEQPLRLRTELSANFKFGKDGTETAYAQIVKPTEDYMLAYAVLRTCSKYELAERVDPSKLIRKRLDEYMQGLMKKDPNISERLAATLNGSLETLASVATRSVAAGVSQAMEVYDEKTRTKVCEGFAELAPGMIEDIHVAMYAPPEESQ